jgi:hypothetical protein
MNARANTERANLRDGTHPARDGANRLYGKAGCGARALRLQAISSCDSRVRVPAGHARDQWLTGDGRGTCAY